MSRASIPSPELLELAENAIEAITRVRIHRARKAIKKLVKDSEWWYRFFWWTGYKPHCFESAKEIVIDWDSPRLDFSYDYHELQEISTLASFLKRGAVSITGQEARLIYKWINRGDEDGIDVPSENVQN